MDTISKIGGLLSRAVLCGVLFSQAAVAGPEIQSWNTSNGARVLFVAAPDLPMVDVRVVFDAGSARDGDTPGLADMTNSLLNDGAGPGTLIRLPDVWRMWGHSWASVRSATWPGPPSEP